MGIIYLLAKGKAVGHCHRFLCVSDRRAFVVTYCLVHVPKSGVIWIKYIEKKLASNLMAMIIHDAQKGVIFEVNFDLCWAMGKMSLE